MVCKCITSQIISNFARKMSLNYKQAGVDIDAGNELVNKIKPFAKATKRLGADSDLGGFGALFDLKKCNFCLNCLRNMDFHIFVSYHCTETLNFHFDHLICRKK